MLFIVPILVSKAKVDAWRAAVLNILINQTPLAEKASYTQAHLSFTSENPKKYRIATNPLIKRLHEYMGHVSSFQ